MVSGKDLQELEGLPKEYTKSKIVIVLGSLGIFFSQLAPFFGTFFGTKGPNDEWPHAWWSFCFFGSAFGTFGWFPQSQTYKIKCTKDEFILENIYGGKIEKIPLSAIESIEEKTSCFGKYFSITKTEEYVNQEKDKTRWCSSCVCKTISFDVGGKNHENFLKDLGLATSGSNA